MTFDEKFGKEGLTFDDVLLIPAPLEHLAGKEVDDRHRQHVGDHADDERLKIRQAHAHRNRHAGAQLDQRNHGDQRAEQIFFQHI